MQSLQVVVLVVPHKGKKTLADLFFRQNFVLLGTFQKKKCYIVTCFWYIISGFICKKYYDEQASPPFSTGAAPTWAIDIPGYTKGLS